MSDNKNVPKPAQTKPENVGDDRQMTEEESAAQAAASENTKTEVTGKLSAAQAAASEQQVVIQTPCAYCANNAKYEVKRHAKVPNGEPEVEYVCLGHVGPASSYVGSFTEIK